MRRVVCVWLPLWPTDRLRRRAGAGRPHESVVVAERRGSQRVVVAVDEAARERGVRVGATVALAQALTPGLRVVEAEPDEDAAGLERLAAWALRYTPVAAADHPDGLVMDIAGAAHLHGGEAEMLADAVARLARAGITAQVALAPTWAAAWALARHAPGTVAPAGAGLDAVAVLPIAGLRLHPAIVAALHRVGFDTIGELAAAPRAALNLRFGPAVTGRIDAAAGRAYEAIEPVLLPSTPHARRAFAEPLGHLGGLRAALRDLSIQLCVDLDRRGLGAKRLDLHFQRVDGKTAVLRVGASRATRDATHIGRLFGERLDTVDPGFGVDAALLAATDTEPLGARQLASALRGEEEVDIAVLVDRLVARVGGRRVFKLAPIESDVPERGLARVEPLAQSPGRGWADGPRPQRLLDPPEPVEVVALLPDHPPAAYTWGGRRRRVTAADGPESVAGEWWVDAAEVFLVRDYYRVEDEEGRRVWLFRATRPPDVRRWFLHGVFA